MSRLLARPVVQTAPRPLAAPDPADDPFTRRLVDEAAAAAYQRGLGDGTAQTRAAATAAAERAAAGIATAVAEAAAEMDAQRDALAADVVALALAVARAVLGVEPEGAGALLCQRILAAVSAADDDALTVRVAACDHELVAAACAHVATVSVEVDSSLAPGEARLVGRWADAELTRAALLAIVEEQLDAQA